MQVESRDKVELISFSFKLFTSSVANDYNLQIISLTYNSCKLLIARLCMYGCMLAL